MDDPALGWAETEQALRELGRVHRWVGNGALWRQLMPALDGGGRRQRLLDVGTGNGEVAAEATRRAARRGIELRAIGLDRKLTHLTIGRRYGHRQLRIVGDALALPLRNGAVDISTSSLFQHHFDEPSGRQVLAEMYRVAERAVVVTDLRRSWLGGWLGRLVLRLLWMGPISSYDGRISLDQAWTLPEVERNLPPAASARLYRRWPFRWVLELRAGGGSNTRSK